MCFWKLGKKDLAVWDEYTNYSVIYDTIESGDHTILTKKDWFVYRYGHGSYHKVSSDDFLEKPPLWYYLTIFSTKLFGINRFSVRFISASAGFSIVLLIFYIGYKFFSYKAGIISGFAALGVGPLFFQLSGIFSTHTFRSADLDTLQLLFIVLATVVLFKFHKHERIYHLILAGFFSGLGFLSKGPFSTLPIIVFSIFRLSNRRKFTLKKTLLYLLIIGSSFLVITAPWHFFMYIKHGGLFLDTYFGYHIFHRVSHTLEEHNGGIFFYVKLLFHRDLFLFSILFFTSAAYAVIKEKDKIFSKLPLFFCIFTPLLIIALDSIFQTKLSWYISPLYPFAALVIGEFYKELGKIRNKWASIAMKVIIISVISLNLTFNLKQIVKL